MAKTPDAAARVAPTIGARGGRIGRPPEEIPEDIASALCEWLSKGRPMSEFCARKGMPSVDTINQWRRADPIFHQRVADARAIGFDTLADEVLLIADNSENDYMERNGKLQVDNECVARSRLRVDARLKLLACWDPTRYGNRTKVEHSGGVSLASLVEASLTPAVAAPEPKPAT